MTIGEAGRHATISFSILRHGCVKISPWLLLLPKKVNKKVSSPLIAGTNAFASVFKRSRIIRMGSFSFLAVNLGASEWSSGKITEIVNRSVRKMVIGNVLPHVISWRDKWRDIYYRESACNAPLIDPTCYTSFSSSSSCRCT